MEIFFIAFVVGAIIAHRYLKQAKAQVERQLEVEEYFRNKSTFVFIEEVESNNAKLYLAYNYVTKEFIAQGTTEEALQEAIIERVPDRDIYRVTELNG